MDDAVCVREEEIAKGSHVVWTPNDNRSAPVSRQQLDPVELKFQTLLKMGGRGVDDVNENRLC